MKISTIELAPLINPKGKGFNVGEHSLDIPSGAKILDAFVKNPDAHDYRSNSIRRIFLKILEPTSTSTKRTIKALLVDEGQEFVLNLELDHNPFELTFSSTALNLHLFVPKGCRF